MGTRTGHWCAIALAVCSLTPRNVRAEEPTREELLAEVKVLKDRVAALEARQQAPQRSAADARDVDAVVRAMMQDAERRNENTASCCACGMYAQDRT